MVSISLMLMLILAFVHASEAGKFNGYNSPCVATIYINVPCKPDPWLKRVARQDDMGPFWANRGKREPAYLRSQYFTEEPKWVYIRRDEDASKLEFDPFFTTRGKKECHKNWKSKLLRAI